MILSRDAILGAQDLKTKDVPVPEWQGTVRVRTMTGAERNAFGASLVGADGKADQTKYATQLLIRCIVGEDNQPVFTASDVDALGAKNSVALKRVLDAADSLNSIGEEEIQAAEKN